MFSDYETVSPTKEEDNTDGVTFKSCVNHSMQESAGHLRLGVGRFDEQTWMIPVKLSPL